MFSLMRSLTLLFCLLYFAYVTLVSGNTSDDCKVNIVAYHKTGADEEVEKQEAFQEFKPKYYFLNALHSLNLNEMRKQTERNSYAENYYCALYQSVQKKMNELNLQTPKEFCTARVKGPEYSAENPKAKNDYFMSVSLSLFTEKFKHIYAPGASTSSTDSSLGYNIQKIEDCLKAISMLNVNNLSGMTDHNKVKGKEVLYNIYFYQTAADINYQDQETNNVLKDYITYFWYEIYDKISIESFVKVEDFCASPEKYLVSNGWSYEYQEDEI